MKLNDFTVGQTLLGLTCYNRRHRNYSLSEYIVTYIGRKYLQAVQKGHSVPNRFSIEDKENFESLYAKNVYGYPTRLFPTKTAAIQYMEWTENLRMLHSVFSSYHDLEEYSPEQIRTVKDTLRLADKKPVSLKDLSICQNVIILNECEGEYDARTAIIKTITNDGVIVQNDIPNETIEFRLADPQDPYLTEHNPDKTARLLFTKYCFLTEYLLSQTQD